MKLVLVLLALLSPAQDSLDNRKTSGCPSCAATSTTPHSSRGGPTLRYSTSMPGQALAYKMGSARIWELRRQAERELGPKFDLRRFHEAVLGSGSLPLSVLERHVEWWISQEKAR